MNVQLVRSDFQQKPSDWASQPAVHKIIDLNQYQHIIMLSSSWHNQSRSHSSIYCRIVMYTNLIQLTALKTTPQPFQSFRFTTKTKVSTYIFTSESVINFLGTDSGLIIAMKKKKHILSFSRFSASGDNMAVLNGQ